MPTLVYIGIHFVLTLKGLFHQNVFCIVSRENYIKRSRPQIPDR